MVAVPGKSKGCTTCRRRRIRCDLGQPECGLCIKGGKACEGYDRFPTFINRTARGLEKRKHLDETKPRGAQASGSILPLAEPTTSAEATASTVGQHATVRLTPREQRGRGQSPSMLVELRNGNLQDTQLISTFLEYYMPSSSKARRESISAWFDLAVEVSQPGKALQLSFRALSLTRVGWMHNDQRLLMEGRRVYGRALQELQRALWDERLMWLDPTLAAGRALSIYELYESTCTSTAAFSSHESGIARLVQLRGPLRHSSALAQAVLEGLRYTAMIESLQKRKASFFGDEIWRTHPWADGTKDIRQKLYDKGFALAALAQDVDSDTELDGNRSSVDNYIAHLDQCTLLDTELQMWYQELLDSSSSLLYWPVSSIKGDDIEKPDEERRRPFCFPSLRYAQLLLTFWALQLLLGGLVASLCSTLTSKRQTRAEDSWGGVDLSSTSNHPEESINNYRSFAQSHSAARRLDLAVTITRSIPYCITDGMGLVGAQMTVFPLRIALSTFEREGVPDDLVWCQELYRKLTSYKGLLYAQNVAKKEPLWGRVRPPPSA